MPLQPPRALVGADRTQHGHRRHVVVGHGSARGARGARRRRRPAPSRAQTPGAPSAITSAGMLGKVARERAARPTATARSGTPRPRAARDAAPATRRCPCRANAGCAREAAAAHAAASVCGAAIHAVGAEERDRRAREVEVVHRVAIRNLERGERAQGCRRGSRRCCAGGRDRCRRSRTARRRNRRQLSPGPRVKRSCACRRRPGAPRRCQRRRPRWRGSGGSVRATRRSARARGARCRRRGRG